MANNSESGVKQQVRDLLDRLPDDCTIEEIQYYLSLMHGVREGLAAIDRGEGISHEEIRRRILLSETEDGIPHEDVVKRFERRFNS